MGCGLHPADYTEGMPSRVRLIAIDIDGTLLPSSSTTISRRNCRALREAQAAGIHIVIATGRRHQYAGPVLEQVGLAPRTVMISSNGSVVRHFDGKLIQRNLLPAASARALCPALRPLRPDHGLHLRSASPAPSAGGREHGITASQDRRCGSSPTATT